MVDPGVRQVLLGRVVPQFLEINIPARFELAATWTGRRKNETAFYDGLPLQDRYCASRRVRRSIEIQCRLIFGYAPWPVCIRGESWGHRHPAASSKPATLRYIVPDGSYSISCTLHLLCAAIFPTIKIPCFPSFYSDFLKRKTMSRYGRIIHYEEGKNAMMDFKIENETKITDKSFCKIGETFRETSRENGASNIDYIILENVSQSFDLATFEMER